MWVATLLALAFSGTLETSCGEIQDQYTDAANGGAQSCCDVQGYRAYARTVRVDIGEYVMFRVTGATPAQLPSWLSSDIPYYTEWNTDNSTALLTLTNVSSTYSFVESANSALQLEWILANPPKVFMYLKNGQTASALVPSGTPFISLLD